MPLASLQVPTVPRVQRAHMAQVSPLAPTAHDKLRTRMAQASLQAPMAHNKLRAHMAHVKLRAHTAHRKLRTHMDHESLQAPMVTSSQRVPTVPASLQTPTNQRDQLADTVLESHKDTAPSNLVVIINPIHTINRSSLRGADTAHHLLLPPRHRRTLSRLAHRLQPVMLRQLKPQALATAAVDKATITHTVARHRRSCNVSTLRTL